MSLKCEKFRDRYCIVCAKYFPKKIRPFNGPSQKLYDECFKKTSADFVGNEWVPKSICNYCDIGLRHWKAGRRDMIYVSPASWNQPQNHDDDCYICANIHFWVNHTNKNKIVYVETISVDMPIRNFTERQEENRADAARVANNEEVPMEIDDQQSNEEEAEGRGEEEGEEGSGEEEGEDEGDTSEEEDESDTTESEDECFSCGATKFDQEELSDLVRDLYLSKSNSEILASRLKEKKLLKNGTNITFYRKRDETFRKYFAQEEEMVYCIDVVGLINEFGVEYKPENWRLFIDSSTKSLKAVLLNNGNIRGSLPIAHSTTMGEKYDNMEYLLKKIKYDEQQWEICTDLKVVTILLGQQSGFTKHMCFLCLWDSRARNEHFVRREWPARERFVIGENNITQKALVDPDKILLPPLHIQLGIFKQFIKGLKKRESEAFYYIYTMFPKLTDAKIKEGVFTGPQIRKFIKDQTFKSKMDDVEKKVWESFVKVRKNFLGNRKAPNYKEIVSNLVTNYGAMGCLMSLKLHFLDSHLDCFPDNLGDYSDEQGERFHQDIKELEKRYQGFWDINFLADYCWSLKRELNIIHKRRSLRRSFLERSRPRKDADEDTDDGQYNGCSYF